ncbi:MAG: nickel pincer cofactor biosynthesis protein LarC [Planctomycetales bacterium]|nr:nickel pincer cofactor biosynthesis protein LarC [Planctomycetales bacterium]
MRIAYADCSLAGASGDMFLGALVDAGLPIEELRRDIASLGLPGLDLSSEGVTRGGLAATKVHVTVQGESADHHHSHEHRTLPEIEGIIGKSPLPVPVREAARRVFRLLAEAEARVHRTTPEAVHFHEVGAWDAIADVVGTCAGLHRLGIATVRASPVATGRGTTKGAHGVLPIPPPAVVELLRGVPLLDPAVQGELTTPTGAALLAGLASGFGERPPMVLERSGCGAGTAERAEVPNLLRLLVGEASEGADSDRVTVLETNLDDSTPQAVGYLVESLLAAGALDVTVTPALMKKGRPGVVVQALAEPAKAGAVEDALFRESPTFGVRRWAADRRVLPRETIEVETPYGRVRVKVGRREGQVVRVAPEYEDCRAAARERGVPLATVTEAVREAARVRLGPRG